MKEQSLLDRNRRDRRLFFHNSLGWRYHSIIRKHDIDLQCQECPNSKFSRGRLGDSTLFPEPQNQTTKCKANEDRNWYKETAFARSQINDSKLSSRLKLKTIVNTEWRPEIKSKKLQLYLAKQASLNIMLTMNFLSRHTKATQNWFWQFGKQLLWYLQSWNQ